MNNTMSYKGYTASMIFDAEDKIIVGRVLDVDDIITFHGESVSEFEINFHAAVDDYRSACEQLGSAPEKPASGKLMLRVAPTVHAAALKAAARSGVSLNKWAERAISSATRRPAGQRQSRGQTRT
jgi:predicted HicB family RNase H-like nuclease